MGSIEEGKSSKSEKSSPSTAPEHSNVHVYPDWAAMQAYYGHRVAIPPYYNSTMAPGHAPPPYIWAPPSPMMAPYGAPYPAFCPPGGVYAHPGVPMTQGPAVQASPAATTPLSMDTPAKSPGNKDQGFMKKLKEFDGLAMSIGNGKVESSEHGGEPRTSQSSENEGSSNGSDGNTTGGEQSKRKRSREGTPTIASPLPPGDVNGKPTAPIVPPAMHTGLELQSLSGMNGTPQPCAVMPPEVWLQGEKELKRERRKQSNRESARRSRLRKQAETEELARKVDSLTAENMTLRSELNLLNEKSEKLRMDNAELLEKLKVAQARGKTENLLSRVENSESGGEITYEKSSNAGKKNVQHQLIDASPRTDTVCC